MKVNSDGAFSEERGYGGWGAVIRDADKQKLGDFHTCSMPYKQKHLHV
jgi:ribonuclease HI